MNPTLTAASLEPEPAMYLFTGDTYVQRARRERYGHSRTGYFDLPAVTVTVLATDQADAERIVDAMLSTPADTPKDGYGNYIDTYTRCTTWTSVEQAPADTTAAEALRKELTRTAEELDEARSAGRLALQQAEAERERSDIYDNALDRVRAVHLPAGKPAVCVHCTSVGGPQYAYPCPTIRALDGAE